MSAIASFTLLPKSALEELREAAVSPVADDFWNFLRGRGQDLTKYSWSGYFLAVLLPYLDQYLDIRFGESPEFDDLSAFLCNVTGATSIILADLDHEKYLEQLDVEDYSEDELRDFYETFNETVDPESGKAMLDGIAAIRESLSRVSPESIILLRIG